MKVYNTMSRTKEEFQPIRSECVTIYSCGPTVYNYAHIGNMRTYVFMDIFKTRAQAEWLPAEACYEYYGCGTSDVGRGRGRG